MRKRSLYPHVEGHVGMSMIVNSTGHRFLDTLLIGARSRSGKVFTLTFLISLFVIVQGLTAGTLHLSAIWINFALASFLIVKRDGEIIIQNAAIISAGDLIESIMDPEDHRNLVNSKMHEIQNDLDA